MREGRGPLEEQDERGPLGQHNLASQGPMSVAHTHPHATQKDPCLHDWEGEGKGWSWYGGVCAMSMAMVVTYVQSLAFVND